MDKNEASKIMDGLKAIQKHCAQFKHCSDECECEFNNGTICILEQLGHTPDPYWDLVEVENKLNKAIEPDEAEAKKENKMTIMNMIHVLEIIKEFCASVVDKGCQNCPFYVKGFGCGVNVCGGPQYWPLETILDNVKEECKDYDFKTTADKNSAQDMIHHPGHYNFRGMECKDFIEKFVSDPKSYYEGNIFKYLYRYLEKNKEEDLNKAMEYTRLLKEYLYGKKD